MDNGLQIEFLTPHTTTILQPPNLITHTKVKTAWHQLLRKHYLRTNSTPIDKVKFCIIGKSCKLFPNEIVMCIIDQRIMGKAFVKVALSRRLRESRDLSI